MSEIRTSGNWRNMRRAHGSQSSAFAAALPLGIVLPLHLNVPQVVREVM